jgi:hypothetical protein
MGRWKDGCFTVLKERKEECVDGSEEESMGMRMKKRKERREKVREKDS